MKIALFISNAGRNSGGPEMYEAELVRALSRIDRENDYHLYCAHPRGPEVVGVRQENFQYHVLQPSARAISMSTSLPLALRKLKPDAVHATFVPPLFAPDNMAYTLPCTSVWQCPEFFPPLIRLRLQLMCGIGVRRSKLVLCISEHVRDYLRERFGLPEDRLTYVPLGASMEFRPMSEAERRPVVVEKYGLDSPYFLFSGRWEARKNVLRLLVAFSQFKREDKNGVKLAFTGARTWAAREADELIRQLGIGEHIVDLGKTPMSDLPALYNGALAIMYPSLWESFGLVIVEAMRCGVPVLTSNVAAMSEVAGDAGILVNPRNVQQMAEAMAQLSRDKDLRLHLGEAGLERAKEFSWERTARLSLTAYEKIASLREDARGMHAVGSSH